MIVSIDGPVGVGKTSVAKAVAHQLGLLHIDTGAMYRALAWKALEKDLDPGDPKAMTELAEQTRIHLENSPEGPRVYCDGTDVTEEIRSPDVTSIVSQVSAHEGLRHQVVEQQRRLGEQGSVIMEGRDIGSVVFPDADAKFGCFGGSADRAKVERTRIEGNSLFVRRNSPNGRRARPSGSYP